MGLDPSPARLTLASVTRYPIRFDAAYALLSRSLFISPSDSYVQLAGSHVTVRMGWAFKAAFDRSNVVQVAPHGERIPLTRGVHGWAGRWLVNGAGDDVLSIELEPKQRAYVMGFPVGLRQLLVSVEDPKSLTAALTSR
jgi:hypothetical protein